MNGATFCAPHSRMDCSSSVCSSFSVKSIMAGWGGRAWRGGRAAASAESPPDLPRPARPARLARGLSSKRAIVSRAPGDVHGGAAAEIEPRRGARAVGSDLEMIGAAEERADLAVAGVGIRRDDARHGVLADADLERAVRQLVERAAIDVRDQVAEAIDAQHLAVDVIGGDVRLRDLEPVNRPRRPPERRHVDPLREPRSGRREAVAPFEGAAHGRPRVFALGELDDLLRRMLVELTERKYARPT